MGGALLWSLMWCGCCCYMRFRKRASQTRLESLRATYVKLIVVNSCSSHSSDINGTLRQLAFFLESKPRISHNNIPLDLVSFQQKKISNFQSNKFEFSTRDFFNLTELCLFDYEMMNLLCNQRCI